MAVVHAACETCWRKLKHREPFRMRVYGYDTTRNCCACGKRTSFGMFFAAKRDEIPQCKGHGDNHV